MPQYQYKARDKEGYLLTGTMEAGKKEIVADRLAGTGLFLHSLMNRRGRCCKILKNVLDNFNSIIHFSEIAKSIFVTHFL